jgi:hypothetical protein
LSHLLSSAFSSVDNTCSYIQPNNRIEVVLFVAIFSAMVSTPVALLADWMINNILAAPLIEEGNGASDKKAEGNSNLLTVSPASIVPAKDTQGESSFLPVVPRSSQQQQSQQRLSGRMSFAFIRKLSFLRRNTTMKSALAKYEGIVFKEFISLKKELIAYRNSITDSTHQEELDCKFYRCFWFLTLFLLLSLFLSFLYSCVSPSFTVFFRLSFTLSCTFSFCLTLPSPALALAVSYCLLVLFPFLSLFI